MEEVNKEIFEESENFRSAQDQPQSFKAIALKHLQECVRAGAVEMSEGGLQSRIINGQLIEFTAPNTEQIFCNSVDLLSIVLIAELRRFPEHNDQMKKLKLTIEEIKKNNNVQINKAIKELNVQRDNPYYRNFNFGQKENEIFQRANRNLQKNLVSFHRLKLEVLINVLNELGYFAEKGN